MSLGEAISVARTASGLTQQGLADRLGITQAALSRYENAMRDIPDEVLAQIAGELGVEVTLLIHASESKGAMAVDAHMRRSATAPAAQWHRIEAQLNMLRAHTSHLLTRTDFHPSKFLPTYDPIDTPPADAARFVRMQWQMPTGPVRHAIQWVEAAGCFVFEQDFGTTRIDGMSQWIDGFPVILLNATAPTDRKRLTLAHELGHLSLHNEYVTKDVESEANQFAAEFLMPEASIKHQLKGLTLGKIHDLKLHWGTSMQALIERAYHLNQITAEERARLYKQLSSRGWRRREPGSAELPSERPELVAGIGQQLLSAGLTAAEVNRLAGFAPASTANPFGSRARHLSSI